jgi:DNA-binding MarR family transcriptional regulator
MMKLLEKEGITQTELRKAVGVTGYTTTRTLDRMEEMEFVLRSPDPNSRRAHRIFLTK